MYFCRNSYPPGKDMLPFQHVMRSFSDSHLCIKITTAPSPCYTFSSPISSSPSILLLDINPLKRAKGTTSLLGKRTIPEIIIFFNTWFIYSKHQFGILWKQNILVESRRRTRHLWFGICAALVATGWNTFCNAAAPTRYVWARVWQGRTRGLELKFVQWRS